MKVKELSAKAGLRLNIRKTKVMAAEETHNFNTDNRDVEIVKDFAYFGLAINSNGHCSRGIKGRLRLGRAAIEGLGKITKNKNVSLEPRLRLFTPSCSQLPYTNVKAG